MDSPWNCGRPFPCTLSPLLSDSPSELITRMKKNSFQPLKHNYFSLPPRKKKKEKVVGKALSDSVTAG